MDNQAVAERKKLLEISRKIVSTLDEGEVTRLLAKGLSSLLTYDTMAIYVADHERRRLTPIIVEGRRWSKQDNDKWSIPFGRGILGEVISTLNGEMVNDAHKDERAIYPADVEITKEQLIAIPLRLGDYCWGAFAINRMSDRHFTLEEFEKAQFLASYASMALSNIKLVGEVQQTTALRQVISDTIPDSVVTVNEQGVIVFCNDITESLFGYSPGELLGAQLTRIIPEALRTVHSTAFRKYIQTGERKLHSWSGLELQGWHKDGYNIPIEVSFGETYISNRRVFSGIIRDITERKRAEDTIKSTKVRLENLIKTIQAGVLVEDEERRIVLTNKTFCDFFQIPAPPDALTGADCSNAAEQSKALFENPELFVSRIHELLLRREVMVNEEMRLADGRTFSRDYVPIFVEKAYKGHMWLYRDITAQKKIEEDLLKAKTLAEESMKAKQDFLAKMSHELRTPINGVLGLASLIAASPLSRENQEYIQGIKVSGEHLLSIINDILDLARIEAGRMKLQEVEFSLEEVVRTTIQSQRTIATSKGLKLTFEQDENIPPVLIGDPVRLNQIVLNLVSNALKFTTAGQVKVVATLMSRAGDEILVQWKVTDTGIGIPKDKLQVIFDSFTQADRNIAVRFGGTGLGLTIVKQLAELCRGTVEVESEVGKGSTFTVLLPFRIGKGEPARKPEPKWDELNDFTGVRVLLVEDNLINQTVAKKTLEKWGVSVSIAGNGVEAVKNISENQPYDLVIMDIQMPEMDGYETTRHIRQDFQSPKSTVPILAMTASVLQEVEDKIKAAGMDDFITKPFHYAELNKKISVLLKREVVNQPPPAPQTPGNLINMGYIDSIAPGSKAFQNEILTLFDTQSVQYLKDIHSALDVSDFEKLKSTAHAFKPLGAYVGIQQLTDLVGQVEKEAKEGRRLELLREQVTRIDAMVDLARGEIKTLTNHSS